MAKKIIAALFAWKSLILIFAEIVVIFIPFRRQFTAGKFGINLPYLIRIWANFDAYHYMEIAKRGYRSLEQPFFPLLPILIRITTNIFQIPYLISGLLISHISLFFSLFVMIKLFILDKNKNKTIFFLAIILLFPSSFFYGSVYNDSLFLFLATLTLFFARQRRWIFASISGSLATLARLNGLALIIFILVEYLTSSANSEETWNLKKIRSSYQNQISLKRILETKIFFVTLIPAVFIGYLIFNQIVFGHWYLLFKSMIVWHQDKLVLPLQVFWRYAKILIINSPHELTYWIAMIELLFVIFYIFMIFYSFKKIRLSYWVFFVVSLIIPSLTGTFAGMPRYGLHLYPLFLTIFLFLNRKEILFKLLYFLICLSLMFILLGLFTRGYFVA